MMLPAWFSPLFTVPSFHTFTALACEFLAQGGKRTVCGMLTGASLSRDWSHDTESPDKAGYPMLCRQAALAVELCQRVAELAGQVLPGSYRPGSMVASGARRRDSER
jgi:hypothetical protein